MNYLAFDLGASSGKLHLGRYDGAKLLLEPVHRFGNSAIPLGDGLYWDFLHIWHNMGLGIQKAWRQTGGALRSFGVDTYSNDFSFIDKTGDLLSPMRCYRDQRTARCSDRIYEQMPPRRLYDITGNQLALFNSLMQLASMRIEGKDAVLDSAHKLLLLPDLLGYYLTGETVAEFTVSWVTQMYDIAQSDWSQEILDAFRIPRELFGALTNTATITGKSSQKFQAANHVGDFDFVSVCEHDTASAFLASTCTQRCAIISSGTWSLVGTEADAPIVNDFAFRHNIANEGSSLPGHHRLIRNVMGFWVLQEVLADYRLEGQEYGYDQFEALAAAEPPFRFLVDVDDPLFFQPGNMRAKIRQKCLEHGNSPETPGEIARCLYDSLAMKYRWAVDTLELLTGHPLPVVSVIGGGSKDALSCQLTANACGRPVQAGPADASALGNILAQLLAHKEISSITQGRELLARSYPVQYYEPAETALWQEQYQRYKQLFNLEH